VTGEEAGRGGPAGDSRIAAQLRGHLRAPREGIIEPRQGLARSVGDAVRQVIDRLTATNAPPEVLSGIQEKVAEVGATLSRYDAVRSYEGVSEASGLGRDNAFFDWSPLMGMANPIAPPLVADVQDGLVIAHAVFGMAYEGPPGCVHGGFIAAAFDEVLGLAQSLSGKVGMTGTLTVRYRRPTPLNTELRFEAQVDSVSGRKVFTSARLSAGEELTAEATGLFISIPPERFQALASFRNRRS
jgi:acyl-coenzyme A thioesterase PaaI-like protein